MLRFLKRFSRKVLPDSLFGSLLKWALAARYLKLNTIALWNKNPGTPWVFDTPVFDAAQRARYAREEYDDYLRDARLDPKWIQGKELLEIGPGETLGVAIQFLNAGAARVVCVDRFDSLRPAAEQLQVYRRLEKDLGIAILGRYVTQTESGIEFRNGLEYRTPFPAEKLTTGFRARTFDLVFSRAVLEHVYDLEASLNGMHALLKPAGLMVHEVDFRDHGMFSGSLNPLTFLAFPQWTWKWMSNRIGAPNRHLTGFFQRKFAAWGYETRYQKILTTGGSAKRVPVPLDLDAPLEPATQNMVARIRPHLAAPFRGLSDAELAVGAIFLTARKP